MSSIPLVPSLILGLFSFLSSAFILCRIVLPILPPGSCYRRTPSKKYGLCSADISHAWLSIFDALSLIVFLVQVFCQFHDNSLPFDAAKHGDSAARLWLALTTRQTCLLIVLAITLLNVRLGRSTYFGIRHVQLWLSTIGTISTGAIAAAVLSISGFTSLFGGIAVYLSVVTLLATTLLGFLVLTLSRIKRNLERDRVAEEIDSWPNPPPRKPRTSFGTDEIHRIKDGASWITSIEGSARRSLSPWSFATSHAEYRRNKHTSRHSMPASFYSITSGSLQSEINAIKHEYIPPVPPLPSPYKKLPPVQSGNESSADGTPNSWLTSLSEAAKTMSPFSFPTTGPPSLKSITSRFARKQKKELTQPSTSTTAVFPVTFAINKPDRRQDTATLPLRNLAVTASPTNHIVTTSRVVLWLTMIWLPFILTMPYLILARANYDDSSIPGILLAIAQTIPSPLLALSIFFQIRLPIPSNLFTNKPQHAKKKSTATTTALPLYRHSTELRVRGKSGSYTVVEGRRSGDIWVETGQAVNGRSKTGRVMSLLAPNPQLSVLPLPEGDGTESAIQPAKAGKMWSSRIRLSQDEDVDEIARVPQRVRPMQAIDSSLSATTGEDSPASQFQVMTAQRYQPFPARILQFSGGRRLGVRGPPLSPPPTTPLPLTPDESLEEGRSLSPKLIKDLATGMLPILVPGLIVADSQPVTPTTDTTSGSQSSGDRCRNEVLNSKNTAHSKHMRRSQLTMTPPDAQSTPRFQFPKHPRPHHSLPPLPGNSMIQSTRMNHSTPARDFSKQSGDQSEGYDIPLMPEEDTLTRKFNSLIRSIGSPETPSSGHSPQGTILHGILSKKSPVKPLVLRRAGGVTRHQPKSQRYSPLKATRPSGKPARKQPRDSKVLYNVSSARDLRALAAKDASPEKIASPAEYIPAVNRLSAIIMDYQATKKQTSVGVIKDLSGSKASYSSLQRQRSGSSIGEFAEMGNRSSAIEGKENLPTHPSSKGSPFSRTDTAKQRTRLMQNQQLPTVVIRPPSGRSFQAFGPERPKWAKEMI